MPDSFNATVPEASGNVIVRLELGSATVRVVLTPSFVEPSNLRFIPDAKRTSL